MRDQVSCWIIGETTLSIQCAETLLDGGHTVRGIATENATVARWARENDIPVIARFADLPAALTARPYDYLFSIVNARVLRADVLGTALRGAVNYHDGPLPRYAGMHSTSWAILNQETTHGITWHVITDMIDAGAILKQRAVDVDPDDTALSLNAKCYEAAAAAFAELVDDIGAGAVQPREQDLGARTYYARLDRPPVAGIIAWNQPARAISALVRALDFGPSYPNPLARAKIACGKRLLICGRLAISGVPSTHPPSTIVDVDERGITVATADYDVVISGLCSLDGEDVNARVAVERNRLHRGMSLGMISGETAERITTINTRLARNEAYWVRALARTRLLELPFLQPHSMAPENSNPKSLSFAVPTAFRALSAGSVAPDAQVIAVLSAFAIYLSRVTGETSVHLGLKPAELRELTRKLERLFARQVPLQLDVDTARNFAQQMEVVTAQVTRVREQGTFVWDVLTRYPELRGRGVRLGSSLPVVFRVAPPPDEPPPSDQLDLALDVTGDGREVTIWSRDGTFEDDGARRIAEQLQVLMEGIGADASAPVGEIPILAVREREQLLNEWNATATDYPRNATVHQLFEAQAARTPDAPALTFGEMHMTFAEMDRDAEEWAGRLRARGVGRDVLVGLRTTRSPDMVVGMLAILKAGGAYLPLDVSYPAERTRFMLEDAGVTVVLTQTALRADLPDGVATVLCIDAATDGESGLPAAAPGADAESLAYVIYTSGSTGTPKGVLVRHRGVVNYLSWCIGTYEAGEGAGSPVHSSAAFDLTVTSLFAPLIAGRPVHLLDEALGVEALATALRERDDHTLVKITPSHLDLLRHQLPAHEAAGRTRAFVIGGESLAGGSLTFWQQHAPATRLINEYGPTETVVGCCVFEVPPEAEFTAAVPIGRPIANTRLYVLDSRGQLLPVGAPGELYIGGDGVARGYLNRPELTAERFVADPFSPDASSRLYRTGDRVRYRPDGNLEFLGRLDGQVKVRGYRIELGEIEATLASHAGVDEASATVWQTAAGDQRLVAYYTAEHGRELGHEELRGWLARTLPDYMIPSAFELLVQLPLTPNGKIDRAALPAPSGRAGRTRELVAPRSDMERELVRIWEEVLRVPVGITDDFFELGGHSLLAVRMIQRVREDIGRSPPLAVLLTRPTVEHVAAALISAAPPDDPQILQLAAGNGGPPFFYLHGDFNGSGFYVHTLARQLEPGQAMYAIRPHRPGGPESIEGMATDFVSLVRSVQPAGPYLMGGLCNGGAVVYEMARQLREQGESVALLAIVNTAHRNARLAPLRRLVAVGARVLRLDEAREREAYLLARRSLLTNLETLPPLPRDSSPLARARAGSILLARYAFKAARRLARRVGLMAPAHEPDQVRAGPETMDGATAVPGALDIREMSRRHIYIDRAMRSYAARPCAAHASVIWWEQSGAFDADPELHGGDLTRGWGDVAASADVHVIQGPHRAVPGRNIEALGRELSRLIQAARKAI